jgi:DNA (cytosine-5)-methyltransferase 1
MRGRNPYNPSDRTPGIELEQRLESNSEGICNTITTVQKDNLVLENNKIEKVGQISNEGSQCGTVVSPNIAENYRIRKLTPRECWRLMGFTDTDFEAAEKVNSNTQLYKQAGNSIVKNVLMAIFKQMIG